MSAGKKNKEKQKINVLFLFVLLAVGFALLIGTSATGFFITNMLYNHTDWPSYGHDPAGTGFANTSGPTERIVLWTYSNSSSGFGSPVVSGSYVYAGTSDSIATTGYISAFNNNTGALQWMRYTGTVGPAASLSLFNNTVFIGNDSSLNAYNATTGSLLWIADVTQIPSWSVAINNTIYIGDGASLLALYTNNGTVKWNATFSDYINGLAVYNDTVFAGTGTLRLLLALNATNGSSMWNFTVPASGATGASSPAASNGMVYFASDNGVGAYAVYTNNGTQAWNLSLNASAARVAVAGTYLYISATTGSQDIIARNATTGVIIWDKNLTVGGGTVAVPTIASNGMVFVKANIGLYALNATTGSTVWSDGTFSDTANNKRPALSEGTLYVTDGDYTKLVAFGPTLPDLLVRNITFSQIGPVNNTDITITAQIFNNGTAGSSAFNVSFFVDGTLVNSTRVSNGLASGSSTYTSFPWTTASGAHDLKFFADAGSEISESRKINNNLTESISVDWPFVFQGAQRLGLSHAGGPVTLTSREAYTADASFNSPILANSRIYATAGDQLYALDASVVSSRIGNITIAGTLSAPAFYNNTIFVANSSHMLAFNASNVSQLINVSAKYQGASSAPVVIDNIIYVTATVSAVAYMYALNATNLTQNVSVFSEIATSVTAPGISNGYVYVGIATTLYAFNATLGNSSLFSSPRAILTAPLVVNDTVYVGASDNAAVVSVYALNASNVSQLLGNMTYRGSGECCTARQPAFYNNTLYVGIDTLGSSSAGGVLALNASNLSQVFVNRSEIGDVKTGISIGRGGVYVANSTIMYVLSPADLSTLDTLALVPTTGSAFVVADSVIYAAALSTLYALVGEPAPSPTTTTTGGTTSAAQDVYSIALTPDKTEIEVLAGESGIITIQIKNTGTKPIDNIALLLSKLPAGWVVLSKDSIDKLAVGEVAEVRVAITPEENATEEAYEFEFSASSAKAKKSTLLKLMLLRPPALNVTITACPEKCPAPSAWSRCIERKRARNVYACSAQTNYTCAAQAETKKCTLLLPMLDLAQEDIIENWWLIAFVIATILTGYYYYRRYKKRARQVAEISTAPSPPSSPSS